MARFLPVAVFALVALGIAQPGWAASARSTLALSDFSNMTCAQFTHLSPSQRDSLVRRANLSNPGFGLSTPTITRRNGRIINPSDTGSVAGTPLDAGMIISACQAVSPATTVNEAYSRANSRGVFRIR